MYDRLVTLLILLIPNCMNININRYEWTPTESSVPDKMVEIVHGEYLSNKGDVIPMAANVIVNSEWGLPNSEYIQGDEKKEIPEKIKITWYSYSEDVFYELSEQLPDLTTYFKKGLYDHADDSFKPIDRICAGFAPGGHVNIWLQNIDQSILLVSYKGKPVDLDWNATIDVGTSKEEFIKEAQREYKLGAHESYTEQDILSFNNVRDIELEFTLKGNVGLLDIQYFNGEKKRYAKNQMKHAISDAGPMKQIDLEVDTEQGKRRVVLDFNKTEMLETFAQCKEKPIYKLLINVLPEEVKIDVHCNEQIISLRHFKRAMYRSEG